MSNPMDLETLKSIFADDRTHVAVGKVLQLGLASDRSVLRAKCRVITQDRDVVARVCWDAIGPNSGSIQFPQVGDLVLLEFSEGDDNQPYLTKRLSNKTDTIPAQAISGDLVHRALEGKKLHLLSDTQILLGLGGSEADADEPLVLGNVFKSFMSTVLDTLSTQAQALKDLCTSLKSVTEELNSMASDLALHHHGNFVPPVTASVYSGAASTFSSEGSNIDTAGTAMTDAKTVYNAQKVSPIDDSLILSDLTFTEKG